MVSSTTRALMIAIAAAATAESVVIGGLGRDTERYRNDLLKASDTSNQNITTTVLDLGLHLDAAACTDPPDDLVKTLEQTYGSLQEIRGRLIVDADCIEIASLFKSVTVVRADQTNPLVAEDAIILPAGYDPATILPSLQVCAFVCPSPPSLFPFFGRGCVLPFFPRCDSNPFLRRNSPQSHLDFGLKCDGPLPFSSYPLLLFLVNVKCRLPPHYNIVSFACFFLLLAPVCWWERQNTRWREPGQLHIVCSKLLGRVWIYGLQPIHL